MTKPDSHSYYGLEEQRILATIGSQPVIYEHWHRGIDHEHHVHIGNTIVTVIFRHENCEGDVQINTGEENE